ncbi:MAG: CbbX protein [Actinomycetota bacterium]|nr:CbbX protein [Actinomycetota bacterium]
MGGDQAEAGGSNGGSSSEEFSGEVIAPDKEAEEGSAVESVDFSGAVSDGEADVGTVVRDSRIHEVLEEMDRTLIGLKPVKQRIKEIAALLVIDRLREQMELTSTRPTLHMSFTGNPGTGKTTVALRIASILHRLGYIEKGQLVSVTRDDLVGQYVGHTAPKTKEVVKRAKGGVLFIDEAYYLHRPENERDYGQEAIEVLLSVMESERQNLVVVMAGYKDRMDAFFGDNPGLGSRVAHHIEFPDYSAEELLQMAQLMVVQQGYELSEDATEALHEYIERRRQRRRFAYGRSIRNAIERARMRQATRLFESGEKLDKRDLVTIEADDIRQSSVFDDVEEQAPDDDDTASKEGQGES